MNSNFRKPTQYAQITLFCFITKYRCESNYNLVSLSNEIKSFKMPPNANETKPIPLVYFKWK